MEIEELASRFENYHAATKKIADSVTALSGRFDELQKQLDEVEIEVKRPPLGGGGGGQFDNLGHREFRAALGGFVRGDDSAFRNVMESGSSPDGGWLVHPVLSTTWTKKIFDASIMRQISRVETVTVGDSWQEPVDWGESEVSWVGERQARPETDTPTLGMLVVPISECYSSQAVTQRLIDDAGIDVGMWLEGKITEKFGRAESAECVGGNGVGKPKGFLAYDSVATADATRDYGKLQFVVSGHATTVTSDGLRDIYWTLRSPHRTGAVWVMNSNTANACDKLKAGDGTYLWRTSSAAGVPPTLLGNEVRFEEAMPAVAANSLPIAFGDFKRGYLIVDKLGVRFLRDPFKDKENLLVYGRRRVGGGCANTDAIKLLKIST